MRQTASFALCCLLAMSGCAHQPPVQVADISSLAKCAETPAQNIGIAASVLPVTMPAALRATEMSTDVFARRG